MPGWCRIYSRKLVTIKEPKEIPASSPKCHTYSSAGETLPNAYDINDLPVNTETR